MKIHARIYFTEDSEFLPLFVYIPQIVARQAARPEIRRVAYVTWQFVSQHGRGNKFQLMAKSRLRDGTEPAVFVREVAKQQDVLAAFGVLVLALVYMIR